MDQMKAMFSLFKLIFGIPLRFSFFNPHPKKIKFLTIYRTYNHEPFDWQIEALTSKQVHSGILFSCKPLAVTPGRERKINQF